MVGEAVGQWFDDGWVVQLAQPTVVVPERVSGKRGTLVPPQSDRSKFELEYAEAAGAKAEHTTIVVLAGSSCA